LISNLQKLFLARGLVYSWVGRTIRGRYQQSLLGWFWAILQPLATVVMFSVIFSLFIPVDTGGIPYPIFSYVAVVPWALFSSSLNEMSTSLVSNMNLVTKIYFPREALPIAAMLARLLDFAIATGLLVVLMLIFQVKPFLIGWLFLPIIFAIQIALMLGLGLITAALNVFFRDIQPLLALIIQLWFYASPIVYPVTVVPEHLQTLYFLNPMAGVIEAYRAVLLNRTLPGAYLIPAAIISTIALVVGYWLFKRLEFQFADIV
jgi:lipopolysaccharide transport system permease protein